MSKYYCSFLPFSTGSLRINLLKAIKLNRLVYIKITGSWNIDIWILKLVTCKEKDIVVFYFILLWLIGSSSCRWWWLGHRRWVGGSAYWMWWNWNIDNWGWGWRNSSNVVQQSKVEEQRIEKFSVNNKQCFKTKGWKKWININS